MALTGGHKCVLPPFKAGDIIEAKEVVHRAFGPNLTRWVLFKVEGIRSDNKLLLSTTDPSYMPSVCIPYRAGWFRLAELTERVKAPSPPVKYYTGPDIVCDHCDLSKDECQC